MNRVLLLAAVTITTFSASMAWAAPASTDRVYTADQNSNTVSVINPSTNALVGQIRLGNQRPDVLSPLYKGEINVHGLGFALMFLMALFVSLMAVTHALLLNILIFSLAPAHISSMSFLTTIMTSRFRVLTFVTSFFSTFG